ncbi:MAG: selenium cofactor biosynthesis protein YqeC [Dehalococcoidia bacterium]
MDLYEAFGIRPGAIVAAVGGGGKTSLVYRLALDAAQRGLPSIATTTVKFTRPSGIPMPTIIEAPPGGIVEAIRTALAPGVLLVATSGRSEHGRFLGFDDATISALAALVPDGLVVVEADGSAHRPFKAPAAHEPAIPACATDVVVCVGLEVLGRPLEDPWVHRPEVVARLAAAPVGSAVDVTTVSCVITHEEGGRKGIPAGANLLALLNQPANADYEKLGVAIAQRAVYGGFERAVVATAHLGVVHAVVR